MYLVNIDPVKPGDTILIFSAPDEDYKKLVHAVQFALDSSPVFKDDEVLVGFVQVLTSQINYR